MTVSSFSTARSRIHAYFVKRKDELRSRIRMELYFWGSYENIPLNIKKEIDDTIKEIQDISFGLNLSPVNKPDDSDINYDKTLTA